jgi:hypothetical protein
MSMPVPTAPSFAFVHILFNSTSNWGGADVTPTCRDPVNPLNLLAPPCTLAWNISGNYYNNPSSIGVYAPIATAGNYSLTEQVLASLPPPAGETSRSNYAAVGAIFRSGGGTPGFVGSFAKSPITSGDFPTKHVTTCGSANTTDPRTQPLPQTDCSPNDYQHAYLPASDISTDYWTCLPRVQEGGNTQNPVWDTTPDWSKAGSADTLLAGFGGKPYYPGRTGTYPEGCNNINGVNYYHSDTQRCSNHLNAMTVSGQPLFMQLSLDGQQGDYMYSQLWWTYNPAYYPGAAITASSVTGNNASFTGAIGAKVTGTIGATVVGSVGSTLTNYKRTSGSNVLQPQSGWNSSGVVMVGDSVSGTGIPVGTTVAAVASSGTRTVTLSNNATSTDNNAPWSPYTIRSNKLYVTAMTNGTLFAGDTLSSGATGTVSFGGTTTIASNISAVTAAGSGSDVPSYYILSAANQGPIASGTSFNVQSTKLNVINVTAGSGALEKGAAISGTGVTAGTSILGNASVPYLPYTGTTGTGSNYPATYQLSGATGPTAGSISSTSTILTVASMTSGTLQKNDAVLGVGAVLVAAGTTITGNASFPYLPYTGTTGTGSNSPATYQLSGAAQHVDPGSLMQTPPVTTITLTGTPTPSSPPAVGTALGVTNATLTGCIGNTNGSCSGSTASCSGSGNKLRVCAVGGGVSLSVGSELYGSNVSANTTITGQTSGTTGGIGLYTVSSNQTVASSTIPVATFIPDSVTGSISGTTMTVTVAGGTPNLSAGDVLFGGGDPLATGILRTGIRPNTRIVARGSGTGGTGTYTITPSQTVGSGIIMARAAVVDTPTPTANSFTVSRPPATTLSGANICGGACPILLGEGMPKVGQVNLSNIVNYDDWSMGFACVKGIDPNNIQTVVNVMSKQGTWTELVQ